MESGFRAHTLVNFHHLSKKGPWRWERSYTSPLEAGGCSVSMSTWLSASAEPKPSARVILGNLGIQSLPTPRCKSTKPQPLQQKLAELYPQNWGWVTWGLFPFVPSASPTQPLTQLPRPCLPPHCTWLPLADSPRPLAEDEPPQALSSCQALLEPGRHLLGTTCHPARPGVPAVPH